MSPLLCQFLFVERDGHGRGIVQALVTNTTVKFSLNEFSVN